VATRKEPKARIPVHRAAGTPSVERAPTVRTALLVFVALLILVRWLNLFLALQIASTDRQVRIADEQRRQIERENSRLRYVIGQSESPRKLAARALGLGYHSQQPLYIGAADRTGGPSGGETDLQGGTNLSTASASASGRSPSTTSLIPGDLGAGNPVP